MSDDFLLVRPVTVTADMIQSTTAVETVVDWNSGTTYAAAAVVAHAGRRWESAAGSNTNHEPGGEGSEDWWLDLGATNPLAMFDGPVQSRTVADDELSTVFKLPADSFIDVLTLLNISAATAQVVLTDDAEGVVYDETIDLTSDSGISDYWEWFFEPIVRLSKASFLDLPPYSGATVQVTLLDPGQEVACGDCTPGLSRALGVAAAGAQIGITDYSRKDTDDFGNMTVVERAFADRANYTVWINAGAVDETKRLLTQYRAKPLIWIGSAAYAETITKGFCREFSIEIAYPTVSLCSISIEGLT